MEDKGILGKQCEMKTILFLIASFFYFLISFLGFVFTSGGWVGALVYKLGGGIFFLVNYIIWSVIFFIKKPHSVVISKKLFFVLILIQLIALFLNVGDYGDNSGSFSFFEVIFGRSHADRSNFNKPPLLGVHAGTFAFTGVFAYLLCLAFFQFVTFVMSRDQAREIK